MRNAIAVVSWPTSDQQRSLNTGHISLFLKVLKRLNAIPSIQKKHTLRFIDNISARWQNNCQNLGSDCSSLCRKISHSKEHSPCLGESTRAKVVCKRKGVRITNIARPKLRGLDLASFDKEMTVAIVGDVEFCQLHCCSSVIRDSFSGCCDNVSVTTVSVCITDLNCSRKLDRTSRYLRLGIPWVISRWEHITERGMAHCFLCCIGKDKDKE